MKNMNTKIVVFAMMACGFLNISAYGGGYGQRSSGDSDSNHLPGHTMIRGNIIPRDKGITQAQNQYNNSLPKTIQNYATERSKIQNASTVNLIGQDLSNQNLTNYNLVGAGLLGIIISETTTGTNDKDFSYADLTYSCLVGITLENVNFSHADLSNAYLSWSDCKNANFTGATLTTAHLEGANLTGANFSNAIVNGATYDQYTTLPASLTTEQIATMAKINS